jgi:hypothetical protein
MYDWFAGPWNHGFLKRPRLKQRVEVVLQSSDCGYFKYGRRWKSVEDVPRAPSDPAVILGRLYLALTRNALYRLKSNSCDPERRCWWPTKIDQA